MEKRDFCQSCSMPLDDKELHGTEKDGSISTDYCRYCYLHGQFLNPGMTIEDMRSLVMRKMDELKIPADIIEAAVERLPHLKRWQSAYVTE